MKCKACDDASDPVKLRAEVERLRAAMGDAATRIRQCDYTMARSVLLEALKAPNDRNHGLPIGSPVD